MKFVGGTGIVLAGVANEFGAGDKTGKFAKPKDRFKFYCPRQAETNAVFDDYAARIGIEFAQQQDTYVEFRNNYRTTVAACPTGRSFTREDSGGTFTNEGATAQAIFDLPNWALGLVYEIYATNANGVRIRAKAGDTITINATTSASGGRIESAAQWASIILKCIAPNKWLAIGGNNLVVPAGWAVT